MQAMVIEVPVNIKKITIPLPGVGRGMLRR